MMPTQTVMPWLQPAVSIAGPTARRAARGLGAWASGHAAEDRVAAVYADRGAEILERCWRSAAGEVDLVLRDGDYVVFVEVKRAETHDVAATRLSRRQMDRICQAALIYADRLPTGALTNIRFDAALVDARNRVEILENAFGLN